MTSVQSSPLPTGTDIPDDDIWQNDADDDSTTPGSDAI